MTKSSNQQQSQATVPQWARPSRAAQIFSLSKATLLRLEKDCADFPKPARPNGRITLYNVEKLGAFLETRAA